MRAGSLRASTAAASRATPLTCRSTSRPPTGLGPDRDAPAGVSLAVMGRAMPRSMAFSLRVVSLLIRVPFLPEMKNPSRETGKGQGMW